MRLLLDTHTFLWWDENPSKLSSVARLACEDENNSLYLSVVSAWEIQIKTQIGKLQLASDLEIKIIEQQKLNHIQIMPILLEHIYNLKNLKNHHRDPFDRLLIAQAQYANMIIVTTDVIIAEYNVKTLW